MQSEDSDRMTSKNQRLVMVPKSVVEKMWKCQICTMIMFKPMSIPECLHIFCQKCIRGKITKEGLKRCPICNIELGRAALDRLRIDHNMTSIRKKLIDPKYQPAEKIEEGKGEEHGLEEEEEEEEEETRVLPQPTFPLPSKKKERSLSSLAKSPKYSDQSVGRTKSVGTKAGSSSQVPALSNQEPAEKLEKQLERLSLPKAAQKKNKNSGKSSKGKEPIRVPEKCAEPTEVIIGLERQINPPAETASEPTPYNKPTVEGSSSRGAKTGSNEEEIIMSKGKGKLIEETSKLIINIDEEDDEKREVCAPPVPEQPQRTRRGRPKKATVACEERVNVNKGKAVVNSVSGDCEKIMAPIWLTLLASDNQEGRAPLPQIPSCYLRIKDVNLTISYLKKYIMQKLVLESEDEVEISLWGQPLLSSMKLHSLIGMWSQIGPTLERVKTQVGASAEDFVMVLCYGRKSLPY